MNKLPVPMPEESVPYLKVHPKKQRATPGIARFLLLFLALAMVVVLVLCLGKLLPNGIFGFLSGREGPSGTTTPAETGETTTSLYEYNAEAIPEGAFGIRPCNLSAKTLDIACENLTNKEIPSDIGALKTVKAGAINVLILCTHPYESYAEEAYYDYTNGTAFSSSEPSHTVAAVAQAFCNALNTHGVGAVYLPLDIRSGMDSYRLTEELLTAALVAYPDVQYIFDIHRDMLLEEDGTMLRPVIAGEDGTLAQLRLVVGAGWDGWQARYGSAAALAASIDGENDSLRMPTRLCASRLNQHLTPTVFTVEIGTGGNPVQEALRTADLLGKLFAKTVVPPAVPTT